MTTRQDALSDGKTAFNNEEHISEDPVQIRISY